MLEGLVTQNYDPTYVPALPSNVTGPSSSVWKEYTADKTASSVPLDEAKNIVGMGFDAAQTERKLALETQTPESAPAPAAPPKLPPTAPESAKDVNTANQTNPNYRNTGKVRVDNTPTDAPIRDVGIHH